MKMKEHEHDGVKIVAYRFPENKPVPDDPDGLRFNFEPCFAIVGDELMTATHARTRQEARDRDEEAGKKSARPRGGVARSGARRRARPTCSRRSPTRSSPTRSCRAGIGLADARKEVAELVAFVKTLGTARIELDVTDEGIPAGRGVGVKNSAEHETQVRRSSIFLYVRLG